ncbi:hypothetical protein G9H61_11565 [Aquirufa ecclesiirivi]|uniref:Uncharacterized protein n=1 Tax=Aquirufa ecclesiirivi TaxID=2715124 RepID=A0ABT4JII7_9BACT|nr:hypothetical protein [Aquirufa ecclesiirivi]MCZ2473680.1 hypothetical protein [Aquirufa ecclesiirivi]MCZ2476089.1 hypothetical protein [Aquirufa ecclesiirivi]NHC49024.1 hypothetical protein [Aquirufa ecclesiirivi]
MKEAVDEVLTSASAWAMRVGVKSIGDSGVNHGSAKRNSPWLNDKERSFFVSFFQKKKGLGKFDSVKRIVK